MKKFLKKVFVGILFTIWIIAVSAADSMLDGWWFVLLMFLCVAPIAIIAWMSNNGWLDDILDKDVDE